MSLIGLVVLIAVLGLIVWAITTLIPMPPPFKTAIYVVSVIVLALIILDAFGLLGALGVQVPRVR